MLNKKESTGDGVESILLITLSCVGDAVMTTPVLQALHQAYPKAIIDIVSDRRSESIFHDCPYRGNLFYKNKQRFLRGALTLIRQLFGKRYDIIVDLRTDGLAYLLRSKKRYTKTGRQSYGHHAIEDLMGIIKSIHGDKPLPATHIWLRKDIVNFTTSVFAESPNDKVLAIGPGCGGKKQAKFWPTKNYAQLANALSDIFNSVLIVGGPGDVQLAMEVSENLKLPYIDMCNKTSLLQAAALLQQTKMFIGSDSGLGHVAGAVGTATLTLFSVDDPGRCLPWGPSASWLMGNNKDARNITVVDAEEKIRKAMLE